MKGINAIVIVSLALVRQSPFVFARENPNKAGELSKHVVCYEDFGARGDGETDDIAAIAKAHTFANEQGLPVEANDSATYYIGGQDNTVVIQTDTNFGAAKFIIDDTEVENRKTHVFTVRSTLQPIKPQGITSLKRNQRRIKTDLPQDCVVRVTDSNVKRYIRRGLSQNSGASQTDVFVVGKDGTVDSKNPILWDFDRITHIIAHPMDATTLTITGGHFTTIANGAESKYTYFGRGIAIRRSNVLVDGLEHRITGEGDHGAPYGGFINISDCANVTVRNTTLSGHKTYQTIGNSGKPVSMGSYDISLARALNVSFVNCRQFNDIKDRTRWGIMGSNYCKNLLYEGCELSRFDAHQGVFGATIRNSTLGHAGINAIGRGTFVVENTTVYGRNFMNLRSDYGSTWQGEFVIRNCRFVPSCGKAVSASLIGGSNDGQHDFGYTCYMPDRITIDGLHIDDSRHPDNYKGPTIFANFNSKYTHAAYKEKYPYVKTREVLLKSVTSASGKPLHTSKNPFMFQNVIVKNKETANKALEVTAPINPWAQPSESKIP